MTADKDAGHFSRLHEVFTFHLGVAVTLSWLTSLYAATYAPWVRNIRPLIDPSYAGQAESTWSFLFAFPVVLSVAWVMSFSGREILRHVKMLKNQKVEFGIAAAVAFALFYLSIDRAVAALLIAS
ncbi:hypothetical protein [Microvirga alba]|uniref:Uncharacterized protein n=1 Tax=Microvirga alba TaxID=2791025 RepID=A0A931BWU9_9HYPH|nr:hypothetical protein [Microvirga alba]MBF9234287.1 hypothetical protein [Microvirga alba]